jgi:two-component system response regulator HydG
MRKTDGLELCRRIVESHPDIPVIVITAFGSMEVAIEAIRAGAYDFITKPVALDTIRLTVQRAARHRALSRKVERLQQALRETREFEGLLGSSPPMRQLVDLVDRVAPSDTVVLITGESGTGKELVARALHRRSARKDGPFVAINCAAMPETLLESELFGHAKGAFTDARVDRAGLFVQASKGTLFLDEIGELPLGLQPKLLRALQERRVRPLGATAEASFDARIVAATNRDLESAVEDGRFREDLFYRIHVIEVDAPPLRVRGNDILLLAQHFIEHFATISGKPITGLLASAADKLLAYPWPGNVRELQNCIERAVTLCRYAEITVEDLPEKVRDHERSRIVLAIDDASDLVPMDEIERRYVTRVFDAANRNKSLAAKILGFNRKTLYRKLRQYGVLRDGHDGEE